MMMQVVPSFARRTACAVLILVAMLTAPAAMAQGQGAGDRVIQSMDAGDYASAAGLLEQLLIARPDDATAWFLLGRCYNKLGDHAAAVEALQQAGQHGLDTPQVHRELAVAMHGVGEPARAKHHYRKAMGLDDADESAIAPAPGDGLDLDTMMAIVYNSNVALRPNDTFIVPGTISQRESMGLLVAVNGRFSILDDGEDRVDVMVGANVATWFEVHEFDSVDLYAGAEWRRVSGDWAFALRPVTEYTFVGGDQYRWGVYLATVLERRLSPQFSLAASYTPEYAAYFFDTFFDVEDLDGWRHHLAIGPLLSSADGRLAGSVEATFEAARPAGSAVQYDAWGVRGAVRFLLRPDLLAELTAHYRRPRFLNASPRHFTGGSRRDEVIFVTAKVTYRLCENQTVELFYSFLNNDSNIPFNYEFQQAQVGLAWRIAF